MMWHATAVAEPGKSSPRTFFEVLCPNLLLLAAERRGAREGRVAFEIEGSEQGREWVIDFARGLVERDAGSADLTLTFEAGTFQRFLDGTLRLTDAYHEGSFGIRGDRTLIAELRDLFAVGLHSDNPPEEGA